MNNSPWPMVTLKKLLHPISRQETVEAQKTYALLGAHWYATGLYTKDTKLGSQISAPSLYRVEEGDFVYNRLFAWKGSFAIATAENAGCYVSNEFPCFLVDTEKLDRQYLWYYFSRADSWAEALGLSHGATPTSRNRLKEAHLLTMSIPLPPLAEQHRIVDRIEALAGKVQAARELQAEATKKNSMLLSAFLQQFFNTHSDTLIKLGENVIEMSNGFSRRPSGVETGPIILRLADVSDGIVSLSNPRRGNLSDEEMKKYGLQRGDLLFVRVNGSSDIVGRCIPFFGAHEAICYNDHLIRVRLNSQTLDWQYVWLMSKSPQIRKYLQDTAITTAGQMTVNQKMLNDIALPFVPLSEQRRIVAELDGLQARLTAVQKHQAVTQAALDALLPSILDQAFRGEL